MTKYNTNEIYRALQALPEPERLRLVERVIHELADVAKRRSSATNGSERGSSLIGLWADEPAVDQMLEGVLREREDRDLRANPTAA